MILGYEGVFCHINTDECTSQPCLNNGKCIDKINSFHCECPKGEKISGNAMDVRVNGVKVKSSIGSSESLSVLAIKVWIIDFGC